MSRGNAHTVFAAIFSDHCKNESLSAIVAVHFVACFIMLGGIKGNKSFFLRHGNSGFYCFALCFGMIKEFL